MLTQAVFTAIVLMVVLQRLFELRLSRKNAAYILTQGGKEEDDNALGWVKAMQISWFLAMLAEVWLLNRPFILTLAILALILTLTGQVLRYFSMQALGWRWTLPIMTIPSLPVVDSGIYRYLRHPNWLGVILEIAALPLIHSAYLTAGVFTILNAILMSRRLQAEEAALLSQTNYGVAFAEKPRFWPVRIQVSNELSD